MRKIVSVTAAALLAITLLTGCGGVEPNKPLNTYERNSTTVPILTTVSTPGTYALFPGYGIKPLEKVRLDAGDRFGFSRREEGVAAVYTHNGTMKTVPLDNVLASEYMWKMQVEKPGK